jgi:hypothetical protein
MSQPMHLFDLPPASKPSGLAWRHVVDANGKIVRRIESPEFRRYRILSKVEVDANGCWLWQAHCNNDGYGVVSVERKLKKAHRVVYEMLVGPIDEGLTLDHLCRVRHCVNPAHLEPVTHQENILRGDTLQGVNARKTHCPLGHAYDEANTWLYRGSRYCLACRHSRSERGAR